MSKDDLNKIKIENSKEDLQLDGKKEKYTIIHHNNILDPSTLRSDDEQWFVFSMPKAKGNYACTKP
jgi:hypothetical protein